MKCRKIFKGTLGENKNLPNTSTQLDASHTTSYCPQSGGKFRCDLPFDTWQMQFLLITELTACGHFGCIISIFIIFIFHVILIIRFDIGIDEDARTTGVSIDATWNQWKFFDRLQEYTLRHRCDEEWTFHCHIIGTALCVGLGEIV